MNPTEVIRRALPTMTKYPDGDPGITIAFLIRDGIPKADAARVLERHPRAFQHDADYYVRVDGDGRERSRGKLADEPFYTAGLAAAPQVMMQLGRDSFTAIAMQSSEFQAANAALNAGADLANLQASPPLMMWREEPLPPPWWKFW